MLWPKKLRELRAHIVIIIQQRLDKSFRRIVRVNDLGSFYNKILDFWLVILRSLSLWLPSNASLISWLDLYLQLHRSIIVVWHLLCWLFGWLSFLCILQFTDLGRQCCFFTCELSNLKVFMCYNEFRAGIVASAIAFICLRNPITIRPSHYRHQMYSIWRWHTSRWHGLSLRTDA